jgi:small ligand-binding sensory domain FIST
VVRCGDGLASGTNLVEAARTAVASAQSRLRGARADFVVIHVTGAGADESEAALRAGHEVADAGTTIGCSALGVLGGGTAVTDGRAVSAFAASLPGTRIRSFHLEVMRTPAAWAVVGMPVPREGDDVGLLLADPWSFPAAGFVGAAQDGLGTLPLVGGMAHGGQGAGSTRLMVDGVVHDRGAVGAVLGGVRARTLLNPGHRPFGPPMTVTDSAGSVVSGLAGGPAANRLNAAIAALSPDDQALAARGVMLGVAVDEYLDDHGADEVVVRAILNVDVEHGTIELPDPVRPGTTVRFCLVDPHAASAYFIDSVAQLRQDLESADAGTGSFTDGGAVDGAWLATCGDRYADAADILDIDVHALHDVLGAGGAAGMLTTAEIGPVGGANHLHGLASSLLTFGAPSGADPVTNQPVPNEPAVRRGEDPTGSRPAST